MAQCPTVSPRPRAYLHVERSLDPANKDAYMRGTGHGSFHSQVYLRSVRWVGKDNELQGVGSMNDSLKGSQIGHGL